jgi:hypothetical protein
VPLDLVAITPTLAETAAPIRFRTVDSDGIEQGTWTADTRPTAEEAALFATRAARFLSLRVGAISTKWDGDTIAAVRDVAALYAALQIETSFFADTDDQETAAQGQLGRMFREQLAALIATARNNQTGGWRIHSIPIVSTSSPSAYRGQWASALDGAEIVNGPDPLDDDV